MGLIGLLKTEHQGTLTSRHFCRFGGQTIVTLHAECSLAQLVVPYMRESTALPCYLFAGPDGYLSRNYVVLGRSRSRIQQAVRAQTGSGSKRI
jgi:hypothetical protein